MHPRVGPVRAAIVGLGQIGYLIDEDPARDVIWSHAGAYARHSEVEVVAVCDADQIQIRRYQERFGQARGFAGYRAMFDTIDMDIVSVCTPTDHHLDIVRAAAESGTVKAVFCEKPMGATDKVAEEIARICRAHGVVLAVNYMRRWDPVFMAVQELIEDGTVGELRTISAYGATALLMSTSHLIDAMLMFGGKPEWVSGSLQTDYVRVVHGAEDPGGVAFVKFANGVFGFLKGASASPQHYMFELDMLFTGGRIVLSDDGRSVRIYRFEEVDTTSGSGYVSLQRLPDLDPLPTGERMVNAVDDIICCMADGALPRSSGESALTVRRLIACLKESDSRGSHPVLI